MALVLGFVGYAMFLYGWEIAGCIVMGLGVGALWAEGRLTTWSERRQDHLAPPINLQQRRTRMNRFKCPAKKNSASI